MIDEIHILTKEQAHCIILFLANNLEQNLVFSQKNMKTHDTGVYKISYSVLGCQKYLIRLKSVSCSSFSDLVT